MRNGSQSNSFWTYEQVEFFVFSVDTSPTSRSKQRTRLWMWKRIFSKCCAAEKSNVSSSSWIINVHVWKKTRTRMQPNFVRRCRRQIANDARNWLLRKFWSSMLSTIQSPYPTSKCHVTVEVLTVTNIYCPFKICTRIRLSNNNSTYLGRRCVFNVIMRLHFAMLLIQRWTVNCLAKQLICRRYVFHHFEVHRRTNFNSPGEIEAGAKEFLSEMT